LVENQDNKNNISNEEAKQGLQDLRTQLVKVKEAYNDLKKSQDLEG